MKIFVDSADIDEIKYCYDAGIADGVTTNPSLMKQAIDKLKKKGENIDMKGYIEKIMKIAKSTPVSLEVTGRSYDEMVDQGKKLFEMFKNKGNVNIKIPVNPSFPDETGSEVDGIRAVKALADVGIPVNCTLIFTPEQALMAAKAGAAFVSPFAGRIDDDIRKKNGMKFDKSDYYPAEGKDAKEGMLEDNGIVSGVDLIDQCVEIMKNYELSTEVIAASIRNARQTRECALVGADIATLPFGVIKALLLHHKTAEGMKNFTADVVDEYASLTK